MNKWQQGEKVELTIADLSDDGNGVGRYQDRVVFVPDTVPGDHIQVKLLQVKPKFARGKLEKILEASARRIRPACIVADKCGGCQWQQVDYAYQLIAKRNQIIQALERIGGFQNPPVGEMIASPTPLTYRNKATYPLGVSATGQVQAGYFRKNSHRLINLNQCPIQDQRLNPLLTHIKQDIQAHGWPIYNEAKHAGIIRHLSLRIGRRTGETLLTLVINRVPGNPEPNRLGTTAVNAQSFGVAGLGAQAERWLEDYPQLVGVCVNFNPSPGNVIFGESTICVAGRGYLEEEFAGLTFQLAPDTFFQVNTEVAEALLLWIQQQLNLQGDEVIVDAYCGIGALTLPLAQQAQQVIGMEVQKTATAQAQQNAAINNITNVTFQVGTVETLLPLLAANPDIVLVDPPRKGCNQAVIDALLKLHPHRIVYMSCKPSTLARDLKLLCESGHYKLTQVQPADFFPQTAHVECVAILKRDFVV
ncbi:MAG: 23S rRNA (uracil(1939)-C(5))-methyltransferase RlmD [Microcoleaceae cyanobacterium]